MTLVLEKAIKFSKMKWLKLSILRNLKIQKALGCFYGYHLQCALQTTCKRQRKELYFSSCLLLSDCFLWIKTFKDKCGSFIDSAYIGSSGSSGSKQARISEFYTVPNVISAVMRGKESVHWSCLSFGILVSEIKL